jgi:enoyl-CoA hydratase/carnithine racemase
MSDLVTIDMKDGVADVRMNRAEKMNALSPELFRELTEAGESLMTDRSIRSVVLSGNGRAFCAGLDMATMSGLGGGKKREGGDVAQNLMAKPPGEVLGNSAQRSAYVWKELPVPVIAAVHGVAYGAGCQIALAADMRIAAPDARFSVMEIKWGLIPDVAISQTLRPLVPMDIAKDLIFTGRIFDGTEAKELGLVTALADNPLEAALERANLIAGKSPDAIRLGMQLIEETWYEGDPGTALKLEERLHAKLIGSPNQIESVKANFEKRAPNFEDAT